VVERKLNDADSKRYWESVEKVGKEVQGMPSWMKGGSSARRTDGTTPEAETDKKDETSKKPRR
jgi:hypothetical protein